MRHLGFLTSCNMRQTFMVPKYFCENSDILYNPTHFTGPLVCPIRQAPLYILFCACPKPGSGFSMSYVVVFFLVFSELRWEMVVRFVDIGRIVDHSCLNILFIHFCTLSRQTSGWEASIIHCSYRGNHILHNIYFCSEKYIMTTNEHKCDKSNVC